MPRGTAGWMPIEDIGTIIGTLTQHPYLVGERFSAADILYGTSFALFANSPLLPKSPVIDGYAKRVMARPALARAQARDNG